MPKQSRVYKIKTDNNMTVVCKDQIAALTTMSKLNIINTTIILSILADMMKSIQNIILGDSSTTTTSLTKHDKTVALYILCKYYDYIDYRMVKGCPKTITNKLALIKWLIDLGADINMSFDNSINTIPFVDALRPPINYDLVNTLVDAGANINMSMNTNNDTILHLVCKNITDKKLDIYDMDISINKELNRYDMANSTNNHFDDDINNHNEKHDELKEIIVCDYCLTNVESKCMYYDRLCRSCKVKLSTNTVCKYFDMICDECRDTIINMSPRVSKYNANINLIRKLISLGANVNAKNNDGNTPLMMSYNHNCYSSIELLVSAGTDINAQNNHGNTFLHIVARSHCEELINLLLTLGADPNIRNNKGEYPSHIIYTSYNLVKLMINHGYDINSLDNNHHTVLHKVFMDYDDEGTCRKRLVGKLIEYGADFNCVDAEGNTPLHTALSIISYTEPGVVELLIKSNCNINAQNNKGKTPLHVLVDHIHYDYNNDHDPTELQLLLDSNADPTIKDNKGNTPLHITHAKSVVGRRYADKFIDILQPLIKAGADINMPDTNGKTILYYELTSKNRTNLQVLLDNGGFVNYVPNAKLIISDLLENSAADKDLLEKMLFAITSKTKKATDTK